MPNKKEGNLHLEDLFKHLPEFGVVICWACKFAVQPQALASHLLRHQIYRNERQQLLKRLSTLNLLEPEDVSVPAPDAPPLPILPVQRGYMCLFPNCSHSCVSHKRMSQHWREQHGEHDSKNVRARPATLQTFFRGNKIRYFEVNGISQTPSPGGITVLPTSDSKLPSWSGFQELVPSPGSSSEDDEDGALPEPTPALDMQVVRYFHHYTNTPCLTPHRGEHESREFWTETIYQEAFKHHFLMYGILGIAAVHLALEAQDMETCQMHRSAAIKYQSAGMEVFRSVMKNPDTTNSVALIAYGRFIGIQRLMLQQLEDRYEISPPEASSNSLADVVEMFLMFRGSQQLLLSLQQLLPHGSDFILKQDELNGHRVFDDNMSIDNDELSCCSTSSARLTRIKALPQRLAELRALQDDNELQAVKQATTALLTSTSRSYASDKIAARWSSFSIFVRSISDYFLRMLEAGRPAALVLFAHWCPLLFRLEEHYLVLRGQSSRLLKIIRENLSPELAVLVSDLELTMYHPAGL